LPKLKVGILNLKLHPHSPDRYLALFKDLAQLKESTKIWGTRHGVFGKPQELIEKGRIVGLRGYFYHFTEIDPQQPLFDIKDFRQIEIGEGEQFPFSTRYKLHSREVLWLFWLDAHFLFFDLGGIGHEWARKFLLEAVHDKSLIDKYGIVDVEVVSSIDTVKRILSIPTLTKLRVVLSRPNGDDPNEIMRRVKDRMEAQHVRTYIQEYQTPVKEEKGIHPDEEFKAHMELATREGRIDAEGRDINNVKVFESTTKHPREILEEYDPKSERPINVLQRIVEGVITEKHGKMD
jgi:hypothetical protein